MIEIVIEIGIPCSTVAWALPTFGIVERYTEIAVFFLSISVRIFQNEHRSI